MGAIQLLKLFPMSLKLERAPEVKPEVPDLDLKQNFEIFETGSTPLIPEVLLKFTILRFQINF